jgi:hypothetical protein
VREIGKRLRDDMGDCPTLPEEMLDLLRKLDRLQVPPSRPTDREKAGKTVKGGRGR